METRNLILALAADARPGPGLGRRWTLAVLAAVLVGGLVFALLLSPRADLGAVLITPRFLAKIGTVALLALTALPLLRRLARPVGRIGWAWLATAPVVLALAVAAEWAITPPGDRLTRLVGANALDCLALVTLIGLGPLAVLLTFLRSGATTRPRAAGAVAGLAAGGIGASFYALHCTQDSPFYLAVWYVLAIAGLTALGAALAPRWTRW